MSAEGRGVGSAEETEVDDIVPSAVGGSRSKSQGKTSESWKEITAFIEKNCDDV